jgi:hypothetical protein
MKSKEQLMFNLNLSPEQFSDLCSRAGVTESDSFSEKEEELLLFASRNPKTSTKVTTSAVQRPIKKGGQVAKVRNTGDLGSAVVTASHRQGQATARQATKAFMNGFAQEFNSLQEQLIQGFQASSEEYLSLMECDIEVEVQELTSEETDPLISGFFG